MSAKLFDELLATPADRLAAPRNPPAKMLEVLVRRRSSIANAVAAAINRAGVGSAADAERFSQCIDGVIERLQGAQSWAAVPAFLTLVGERLNHPEPERVIHGIQRALFDHADEVAPAIQRGSILVLQDALWTSLDWNERRSLYGRESAIARKIAKAMLALEPAVPAPDVGEPALTECLEKVLTQWSRSKAKNWVSSQLEYIRLFIEETSALTDATEQWTELLLLKLEQETASACTPRRAISAISHATEALLEAANRISAMRRIGSESQDIFANATSLWRLAIPHIVLAAAPASHLAFEYACRLRPEIIAKLELSPERIGEIRQGLLDAQRTRLERIQLDWFDGALRDFQRLAQAPSEVARVQSALSTTIDRTADRLTEGLTDQRGATQTAEHIRLFVREITVTLHCPVDVAQGRQRLRRLVATCVDVAEQPALWRKVRQIVAMLQLPESIAAFGADHESRILPCIREIADAVADQFTFEHRWWAVEGGVGNPTSTAANLPHCYPTRVILDEVGLFRAVYGARATKEFILRVGLTLKDNPEDLEALSVALKSISNAIKFEALPSTNANDILHALEAALPGMAGASLLALQAEQIAAVSVSHLSARLTANAAERTAALGKRDMTVVLHFGRSDTLWALRRLAQLNLSAEGDIGERLNWWWSLAVAKYIVRLPPALAQYHVDAVDRAMRDVLPPENAARVSERIESLYRRVFDIPKSNRRTAPPSVAITADSKQRRALLTIAPGTSKAAGSSRDSEIAAAAPEQLAAIAGNLHSALISDADEEMLWAGRTPEITAALETIGADRLEALWRIWIDGLARSLPPVEAARWTLVLLRGLQHARDCALATELREAARARPQRVQLWLDSRGSASEREVLTSERIAGLLTTLADTLGGAPPSVAALNQGLAALDFARSEPRLSSRLWRRFWGCLDKELPLRSSPVRSALARLCTQMIEIADGLEDAAAFSRWLVSQHEPLFAEDEVVEREWRTTLTSFLVCAITQSYAPIPATALLQRLVLASSALEQQTSETWPETWSALEGVFATRATPRLRSLLNAINGSIAAALYGRSRVSEQVQLDGPRRYRTLLSGLPQAESTWILGSLSAPASTAPEIVSRDERLLFSLSGTLDSPVDATAISAALGTVARTEIPTILKRRLGLLRRETQNLAEADRMALALILRLAALHRVLPTAEARLHIHETVLLGFSKPGLAPALGTLNWFLTDGADRAAKQRDLLPILDALRQHVNGATVAARFADYEDRIEPTTDPERPVLADAVMTTMRQLACGLRGISGTSGLRIAMECIDAGVDPERPALFVEMALARQDATAARTGATDLLAALRSASTKMSSKESAA